MTSRRQYWCSKTKKRRPYWYTKPILWELNSIFMQTFSLVSVNQYGHWSREWHRSIHRPQTTHNCLIRSQTVLALKPLAFESPYCDQFTLTAPLINHSSFAWKEKWGSKIFHGINVRTEFWMQNVKRLHNFFLPSELQNTMVNKILK